MVGTHLSYCPTYSTKLMYRYNISGTISWCNIQWFYGLALVVLYLVIVCFSLETAAGYLASCWRKTFSMSSYSAHSRAVKSGGLLYHEFVSTGAPQIVFKISTTCVSPKHDTVPNQQLQQLFLLLYWNASNSRLFSHPMPHLQGTSGHRSARHCLSNSS